MAALTKPLSVLKIKNKLTAASSIDLKVAHFTAIEESDTLQETRKQESTPVKIGLPKRHCHNNCS